MLGDFSKKITRRFSGSHEAGIAILVIAVEGGNSSERAGIRI
jgi:hypothetical protein